MIHVEIFASITLTLALALIFAVATLQYAAARRDCDTRRTLELAAAAELDRIRAGLHTASEHPSPPPPASQPSDITIQAVATAGSGPWQGLTHVRVVASKALNARRTIEVELAAYMPGEAQP